MSGLPKSVASVRRVDEDRVRKVALDNPDVLHTLLARRFGISTSRFRKIIGWTLGGELVTRKDRARMRYTPRPGCTTRGIGDRLRRADKRDCMRAKIRKQERRNFLDLPPKATP